MTIHSSDQQVSGIQQSLNAAIQHHAAGRLGEAERLYQAILQADPREPRALQLLGAIAHQRGKNEVAVDFFSQALVIKPDYADAHYNLGIALRELGKLDEAAASYRKALAIKPDLAPIHSNLGITLQELGQLDDAVASFRKALAINPDFVDAHVNLGVALQKQGQLDAAVASFNASLAIQPDNAVAHNNLGKVFIELGQVDAATDHYRKALALKPDYAKAHSNLLLALNYDPESSPAAKLEEAMRYSAAVADQANTMSPHPNDRDPERRLKIGIVSGDLRLHSVSHFLRGVLPQINAGGYELYAYATHHREDDVTHQLKAHFAQWRQMIGDRPREMAEAIAADGIDILIDLSGHSANNRLAVFSRKPAPVQVTWLGYSGTTGLSEMDYILCDRWVLPEGEEGYYTETPWRLPDGYLCFSTPDVDVETAVPPCEANNSITFGSFNNLNKMSDPTVACWSELLLAVPGSRLLLKSKPLGHETVRQRVLDRFAALGVPGDRLVMKGRTATPAEHLSLYNDVDIALDPFPYCGTTTTAEALWMRVPVVTLRGQGFVARVGDSILNTVGHGEWVASDRAEYVAIAARLGTDVQALGRIRQGLREDVLASPLCDAPRFARHLEDALRGMWRKWCEADDR